MFIYVGIGILLIIFILVAKRKFSFVLKIPLLLIIAAGMIYFLYYFRESIKAAEAPNWYEIGPWKHIILFVCMLFGMVTNYLYDYLRARIKTKEARASGKGSVELPKFMWEKIVLPIIISVLLFGYFWGEYGQGVMNITILFASYQNGFFWQTILTKIPQK